MTDLTWVCQAPIPPPLASSWLFLKWSTVCWGEDLIARSLQYQLQEVVLCAENFPQYFFFTSTSDFSRPREWDLRCLVEARVLVHTKQYVGCQEATAPAKLSSMYWRNSAKKYVWLFRWRCDLMINLMSVKRENIMSGMPVLHPEPDKLWSDYLAIRGQGTAVIATSSSLSWLLADLDHKAWTLWEGFNTSEGKKIYSTMN